VSDETNQIPDDVDSRADYVMGLLNAEETAAAVARDDKGRFASTSQDGEAVAGDDASGEQDSGDEPDAAPGDPASGDAEETTEQAEEPAIVLPIGWSAEKAEAFKRLPPDVREYITARESERNSHYSRTQQEAAAQRKAAEAELQATSAARQRYAEALTTVTQQLEQAVPKAPDHTLAVTDPARYIAEKAAYDDAVGKLYMARAENARVQEEQAQEQERAYREHLSSQAQILDEKIPEWRDVKVRNKDQQDIAEFLRSTGYGQDEIAAVADARAVQIARKAMLYDRMRAAKPAERKVAPVAAPTLRPGAANVSKRPDAKLAALKQRAHASNNIDDRVAYALAAIGQG
jgi:hypothetical protein